ncbi:MAG TPA: hypothetical protein VIM11_25070 [Tepidisphaeraceae bacterium]|jgi:hypothetical protein
MSHIILAVALLVGDSQIEQLPPVGPPGFALYSVRYKDGKGSLESRLFAVMYDADHKLLGEFQAGQALPKPFEDWRVVGFPNRAKPSVVVTNVNTKQTVELEGTYTGSSKPPSTRPVKIH